MENFYGLGHSITIYVLSYICEIVILHLQTPYVTINNQILSFHS
jgi:hypothetical protein